MLPCKWDSNAKFNWLLSVENLIWLKPISDQLNVPILSMFVILYSKQWIHNYFYHSILKQDATQTQFNLSHKISLDNILIMWTNCHLICQTSTQVFTTAEAVTFGQLISEWATPAKTWIFQLDWELVASDIQCPYWYSEAIKLNFTLLTFSGLGTSCILISCHHMQAEL